MDLKVRLARSAVLRPFVSRWKTYRRSNRSIDEAWSASLDDEVRYWERQFAELPEQLRRRTDPDLPLQEEVATLIDAPAGSTIRILDCGAGPLTFLGKKHPGYRLEIEAVDVLAEGYDGVPERAGIVPIVRTRRCETERLSELYPNPVFDIACARNTLDHSHDPVRGIREMLRVVKVDGHLLLQHAENVAVKEQYLGMHQWNFLVEGTEVKVWRPGTSTDLGEALAGVASVERTWRTEPERGGNPLYHVVIRKTADLVDQR